ncbi:MAG: rhodanese-like domain-containing protein [Cellulophaga sp.]|nr:rhodanese-like domain-containing protein [Cellulophaga sp.]
MKYSFLFFCFLFSISTVNSQRTIEKTLEKFNKKSVPYISVEELQTKKNTTILDSREIEEFTISHLKNAIWVGYKDFDITTLNIKDKNTPIVVYCSIGVRSENIGEKLVANGFTNVKNLYGGIFKWVEKDFPIVDSEGNNTKKVHAFSKHWGKLLTKGEKIY